MNLHLNPSFEQPWTNLLPYGSLTNQQPLGYALQIRNVGAPLLSKGFRPDDPPILETVTVIPECVHKLRSQLPDADLLIRAGDVTFKAFAAYGAFSLDLAYTCLVPAPGRVQIAVPVQVHQHGDGSPGAAVWRIVVHDNPLLGSFGAGFLDRKWAVQEIDVDVDAGDVIAVVLQCESRSEAGIDFFTDGWSIELTAEREEEEEEEENPDGMMLAPSSSTMTSSATGLPAKPTTRRLVTAASSSGRPTITPLPGHLVQKPHRGVTTDPHRPASSLPRLLPQPGSPDQRPIRRHPQPCTRPTAPAGPEPTPTPLPATLIGLHSQRPQTGWLDFYRQVRPSVFKGFELGMCIEAKQASPETLVIYRKHVTDDAYWIHRPDLRASAREFLALYSREFELHAHNAGMTVSQVLEHIDVIETVNEVIGTFDPDLEPAVEFDCCFGDSIRAQYGHQISAGFLTIPVGNPHETEVIKLLPAAEKAYRDGHYLGYHAYWSGTRERDFLDSHWPWLAGRWQEWDKVFSSRAVFPRYYSGETGLVFSRSADGWNLDSGQGWKACGPFSNYIAQILRFQDRCRAWNAAHSNRFIGAVLFCYGGHNWPSFDFEPGDLAELAAALRAAAC